MQEIRGFPDTSIYSNWNTNTEFSDLIFEVSLVQRPGFRSQLCLSRMRPGQSLNLSASSWRICCVLLLLYEAGPHFTSDLRLVHLHLLRYCGSWSFHKGRIRKLYYVMQTKDGNPVLLWRSPWEALTLWERNCPWPGASFSQGVWTMETMWLQESQDVCVPTGMQDSQNLTYQYLL